MAAARGRAEVSSARPSPLPFSPFPSTGLQTSTRRPTASRGGRIRHPSGWICRFPSGRHAGLAPPPFGWAGAFGQAATAFARSEGRDLWLLALRGALTVGAAVAGGHGRAAVATARVGALWCRAATARRLGHMTALPLAPGAGACGHAAPWDALMAGAWMAKGPWRRHRCHHPPRGAVVSRALPLAMLAVLVGASCRPPASSVRWLPLSGGWPAGSPVLWWRFLGLWL